MRYQEILEAVEIGDLVGNVTVAITDALEKFVIKQTKEWEFRVNTNRREELGYHGYKDRAEGYRDFDQNTYDHENQDWGLHADGIGNILNKLLPNAETATSSPVYAAMMVVSKAITEVTQNYIREKFGDPVYLQSGKKERSVNSIVVSVWWTPRSGQNYLGVYRSASYDARSPTGEVTKLEIIVDRKKWTNALRQQFSDYMSGEGFYFNHLVRSIMNTYIHEFEHLQQDIKGGNNRKSLIPKNGSRHFTGSANADIPHQFNRYLGKTDEIDSHATGAAADVVSEIIYGFMENGRRWNKNWNPDQIPVEDWNESINNAINSGIYTIPHEEYKKYIDGINQKIKELDPTIKAKFLTKVKQRFLTTFVKRLQGYLR